MPIRCALRLVATLYLTQHCSDSPAIPRLARDYRTQQRCKAAMRRESGDAHSGSDVLGNTKTPTPDRRVRACMRQGHTGNPPMKSLVTIYAPAT